MPPQVIDTKSFDAEITLHETELSEIIARMDQTAQAFIALCIVRLKVWYLEAAKAYVQDHYELTNQLGVEKVAVMKRRVTQLVMMLPTEAKQVLGDPTLWWHRSRGGGWLDHHTPGPPDGLRMAVEALSERLSPILESYGYLKPERRAKKDAEEPQTQQSLRKDGGRPHLEWTAEMTKCVETYKEDLGRATFLDLRIEQAKKRKAKFKAGQLWESV
jgi:hypothetical protein